MIHKTDKGCDGECEAAGCNDCLLDGEDMNTVQHLITGLKRIIALKDAKEYKCPVSDLIGEEGADKDGFRPIHPRVKQGLVHASKLAQEILDTMPKPMKPVIRQGEPK